MRRTIGESLPEFLALFHRLARDDVLSFDPAFGRFRVVCTNAIPKDLLKIHLIENVELVAAVNFKNIRRNNGVRRPDLGRFCDDDRSVPNAESTRHARKGLVDVGAAGLKERKHGQRRENVSGSRSHHLTRKFSPVIIT